MAKILNTCNLITTALRRAMIPSDQSTFTCCDIIDIMNEEFGIHILPIVLRAHEEYYVIDEDQSLSACTIRYKIPYRAVGNKLRDVQFVDNAGTQYEMTRVSLEDRPEYQGNYTNNQFLTFYLENDDIVLMQNQITNGNIRSSYYLRPNELVKASRGATITAVGNQSGLITITCVGALTSGTADSLTIAGINFTAQTGCAVTGTGTFQALTSPTVTADSIVIQVNSHASTACVVTASSCAGVVTILADSSTECLVLTYSDNDCNIGATVGCITRKFCVDAIPTHFSTVCSCTCLAIQYDFVQAKSPNKILGFDKDIFAICTPCTNVTFKASNLQTIDLFSITPQQLTFAVGDYITTREESIVPQLPTELHPLLAQRTAIKMLEALGDTEGMRNAQAELERMEHNVMTLIDNRVEGAPQKITNRHSILKSSLSNKLYRRRGL